MLVERLVEYMAFSGLWNKKASAEADAWATARRAAHGGTAVFLVHGFGSSAEKTWQTSLRIFLEDDDLSKVSFFAYRYPTKRLTWKFWERLPDIGALSVGLATEISLRATGYKNVVIIAHSMGGLIVRRMIVDALNRQIEIPIRRALLLATPNSGAALASVFSLIFPRHEQASALKIYSRELEALNDLWVTLRVDEAISFRFVAGGFDQIVNHQSVKGIPGRPLDGALIEYGHSQITQAVDADSSNYLFMKKFIIEGSAKEQISQQANVQANPLFEVYRLQHEKFYIKRRLDDLIGSSLVSGNVWIWGESGVGKTAGAMRSVSLSASKVMHVYLGSYQSATPLSLFSAAAAEIMDRLGRTAVLSEENLGSLVGPVADAISKACEESDLVVLLIEEIPATNLDHLSTFASMLKILHEAVEVRGGDNFRVVITSICNPSNLEYSKEAKARSRISFVEASPWSIDELTSLASMLNSELKTSVADVDMDEIIVASKGMPRFIKAVFRDIVRQHPGGGSDVKAIVAQAKREAI